MKTNICLSAPARANDHRRLLEQFSTRWKTEYLQNLQEYSTSVNVKNSKPNVQVGDVVILRNEHSP